MANMSIDDMFLRDPRVARLAQSQGWSKYEARGRLLDVFAIVYDRAHSGRGHFLEADDIDTAAEFPGFAELLIRFDLAVKQDDQDGEAIRIRGSSKRTGYLKAKVAAGRKGGRKSGESRRNSALKQTKQTLAEQRSKNEPKSTLPNTNTTVTVAPPSGAAESLELQLEVPASKSDHGRVVDAFDSAYAAAYESKPSWGPKQGAMVKALLKSQTAPEVIRRIGIMFSSHRSF